MKGVIQKTAAVAMLVMAALTGTGCTTTCGADGLTCGGDGGGHGCKSGAGNEDWDLYDRCYPQRYWYQARQEVHGAFAPQVQNGHVLDQTVWNWDFEPGTSKLSDGGLAHLAYLARRRPQPDCTLYLQTANDLAYDPACPDHLAGARQELDSLRSQAIQKFLVAHTAGRPLGFNIVIHDPNDPSQAATPMGLAIPLMYARYRGGLSNMAGGSGGGSAGAAGGGGAAGGR